MPDDENDGLSTLRRRIKENEEKEAAEAAAAGTAGAIEFDADTVPERIGKPLSLKQEAVNAAVDRIDILDIYIKYCSKMMPYVKPGQREGIKISCPEPGHPDRNPSAWINLDSQTWYCGGCAIGGDKYDIAAIGKGWGAYKKDFHKLKEMIADDFGYVSFTDSKGEKVEIEPEVETSSAASVISESEPEEDLVEPEEIYPEPEEEDEDSRIPDLPWDRILTPDTYLEAYMEQVRYSSQPKEYHLHLAEVALGFALGRNIYLYDENPVYANFFICLLGRTGAGKSRATSYARTLLAKALPHNWEDYFSRGVIFVQGAGSGEVLVKAFQKEIPVDPSRPKGRMLGYAPVSGVIEFNELSALVSRTDRQGSNLKDVLMQFYDMDDLVSTRAVSSGIKTAERPFASCVTSSQPFRLKELLTRADVDSGYVNRWFFVSGRRLKRRAVGGVKIDILPVAPYLEELLAWSAVPREIQWSDKALKTYTEFHTKKLEPVKEHDAVMERFDLLAKKNLLWLTANKKEEEVSFSSVETVMDCFPYQLYCYEKVSTNIRKLNPEAQREEFVTNLLLKFDFKKNKGYTASDLKRKAPHCEYSTAQIRKTLEDLAYDSQVKAFPKVTARGTVHTVFYKHPKHCIA